MIDFCTCQFQFIPLVSRLFQILLTFTLPSQKRTDKSFFYYEMLILMMTIQVKHFTTSPEWKLAIKTKNHDNLYNEMCTSTGSPNSVRSRRTKQSTLTGLLEPELIEVFVGIELSRFVFTRIMAADQSD